MQSGATPGSAGGYYCAVVAGAQVAKLVFNPNHRLLGEDQAGGGGRGRRGLKGQFDGGSRADSEDTAQNVGQPTGAGGQLLVGAGGINFQISERCHAVARGQPEVEVGRAQQWPRPGRERQSNHFAGRQTGDGIVAELVAAAYDGLDPKNTADGS